MFDVQGGKTAHAAPTRGREQQRSVFDEKKQQMQQDSGL